MNKIVLILLVAVILLYNAKSQTNTQSVPAKSGYDQVSCYEDVLKIQCSGDVDLGESVAGLTKNITGPNNKIQFYLYNCNYCNYFIDTNSVMTNNKVSLKLKWTYYYKTCGNYTEKNFRSARYYIYNGLYLNVYATQLTVLPGAPAGPRNFVQEIILSYPCF